MSSFKSFDLLSSLQKTLLEKSFQTPTEIQKRAIPLLLKGLSVVGISETGSGKTLAYVLPVLHSLKTLENKGQAITEDAQPRALVLVPTRELGEQVTKVFKPFTHDTRLRVRSLLGGTTMDVAKRSVAGKFEVLVATPGRLLQFVERNQVNLGDVRFLVFDEADQMLDHGFLNDAKKVSQACADDRQMAMFTATMSGAVEDLIAELFAGAEIIRSQGSKKFVPTLVTENKLIANGKRLPVLEKVIGKKIEGGALIFANTRDQCDKLLEEMNKLGRRSALYRGEMDKVERRANLKKFRSGQVEFLIATDLASRGLDLEHVGLVINYHLPQQLENYIHRVGRTARAGRHGKVINFVTDRDSKLMKQVENMSKK